MTKQKAYNFQDLQPLKQMVWPALKTFTRGTKIPETGLNMRGVYPNVYIEPKKLHGYKNYFGFRSETPISYLYLLVQRAQAALMLQPEYCLSIPGTVHLSTSLELIEDIDPNKGLSLETDIIVPFKKSGSLIPTFTVSFYQNDSLVAKGNGTYLVKRKGGNSNKKRVQPELIKGAEIELEWQLSKITALEYAAISDDQNPIHKNTMAAKLAGFKSQIIHGWYVASRCAQHLEQQNRMPLKGLSINFYGVHGLPGIYFFKSDGINFQTSDSHQTKVLSEGAATF